MNIVNVIQYAAFLIVVILLVKPMGSYMAHVFTGEKTRLDPLFHPIERTLYRIYDVNP